MGSVVFFFGDSEREFEIARWSEHFEKPVIARDEDRGFADAGFQVSVGQLSPAFDRPDYGSSDGDDKPAEGVSAAQGLVA